MSLSLEARETMMVVSSFAYTDMDTTKVRAGTGLEFLRNYLQYAASDGKIFAHGELSDEPMNDFEVDVCDTLTARGMKVVPQVGCSNFRIDFGVCHPTEPGRFVLAIECDGATYHSSYTAGTVIGCGNNSSKISGGNFTAFGRLTGS